MRFFAIALALVAWAGASTAEEVARMKVAGEARVVSIPDLAIVALGAEGQGKTAVDAMNATTEALDGIMQRLAEVGIEEKDVQTKDLSVNEELRWDREKDQQVFVGYRSVNMIDVKVRDMDVLGDVLGKVLTEGANRLGGVRFEMQDADPLRAEARRAAVRDAVEKASLFADAANVQLGRILSIRDTAEPLVEGPRMIEMEPVIMVEEAAEARAVPIAVGEVTVRAEVTVEFEILQ